MLHPAKAFVIRFPNGDFEYDVLAVSRPRSARRSAAGGVLWSVTCVNSGAVPTVHVERVERERDEPSGETPVRRNSREAPRGSTVVISRQRRSSFCGSRTATSSIDPRRASPSGHSSDGNAVACARVQRGRRLPRGGDSTRSGWRSGSHPDPLGDTPLTFEILPDLCGDAVVREPLGTGRSGRPNSGRSRFNARLRARL